MFGSYYMQVSHCLGLYHTRTRHTYVVNLCTTSEFYNLREIFCDHYAFLSFHSGLQEQRHYTRELFVVNLLSLQL